MIGQKIVSKDVVDSTNNYAANLLSAGEIGHGTVILAGYQRAGKGQRGAQWDSEPYQNLLFSCFLKHENLSVKNQFVLNQFVSVALCELLEGLGIASKIKWPNDVVVGNAKIAGILIENQLEAQKLVSSIVGVGLNVNQEVFGTYNATSVKLLHGKSVEMLELVGRFTMELNKLFPLVSTARFQELEEMYRSRLWLKDELAWYGDQSGNRFQAILRGTDERGMLQLEIGRKLFSYDFKEVIFFDRNT
ncbi:MAG: biotin--[acetyl-CoA-carboxylase] ligase [Bacteroidetes bacterium]|nr:MAG: biotin--[acetyl-CoA-carboxylase] ligase [Bacteroidota bacterium]